MRWRLFYADRTTFGHEDGPPGGSPTSGVIAAVIDRPPVRLEHGGHFYWWRDDTGWVAGEDHGFHDQSARYGATWVRLGETVMADLYQQIMADAVALYEEWRG